MYSGMCPLLFSIDKTLYLSIVSDNRIIYMGFYFFFDLVFVFCLFFIFFLFFFFKQKTAYEMRISDWSSDVCSSDLLVISHAHARGGFRLHLRCDSFVGLVTWEMRDGAEEAWSEQRRSVPQPTGGDDRHGSPAGEAGGAGRLVALRRGVRAVLHAKGAAGIADAADGGAAPAQAHGGAVGRSGLRQVGGEPVLPVDRKSTRLNSSH